MILLNTVNKSLEIKLNAAITTTQLDWTLSAVELDSVFKLSAIVANDGVTNSTTVVALLAAPAAGKTRQVKLLTVYNADSVAAIVIIQLNNNSVIRRITKQTLNPGETLWYVS